MIQYDIEIVTGAVDLCVFERLRLGKSGAYNIKVINAKGKELLSSASKQL